MLRLEKVTVSFGGKSAALHSVDLSAAAGEFLSVVGPNGSGKSTLLGAISGAIAPRGGRIFIGGKGNDFRRVARVFQDPARGTVGNFTVLENMALAAMRGKLRLPLPFSRTSRRCAFRDRLATLSLGLEDRLDEPVRNLSGGQRQALSLLMAVLCDCEVLLLDEITAALDPQGANRLMGLVNRTVRESGRTCLMVTHNMQQAIDYGNRLVVLKHGSIASQFYGKEKDNLSAANLYAQFED